MKIATYRDIDRAVWDRLVSESPDAWLTHTSRWIEIEERFFVSANLSFGLFENVELVGIQPLFLSDGVDTAFGERLLHSGIHRHTGLALISDIGAATANAARTVAMKEMLALADLHDVDRVQLNGHNLAPVNRSEGREEIPFWVREHGFHLGLAFGPNGMLPCPGVSTINADQLVDLGATEDELFANLDEGCRRAVRKADKSGLSFEISSEASALGPYIDLARASAARTGEALPALAYYQEIFASFAADGRAHVMFARQDAARVAGLILLTDKNAANFLAGVSLPEALKFRPNDFIHWNAILWAKRTGLSTYRFGPWFPEVPRDWPISKVSHFKTKFGSRSVPIIQGSLFRHPERYVEHLTTSANHLQRIGRAPIVPTAGQAGAPFVAHHLRMFGFPGATNEPNGAAPLVLYRPNSADAAVARSALERGTSVVAVLPGAGFARQFEVTAQSRTIDSPQALQACFAGSKPWKRLRTLHSYMHFKADGATPVVVGPEGEIVWSQRAMGNGASIVLVGTDLASDLMRYRQGDPSTTKNRPTEAKWGFAGERPNYLFEPQLAGEDLTERPADWWCETLADALDRLCRVKRVPMLPNGAPGAIVVTGDDDQAPLARYAQQKEALGSLPVSYFLHPLTKHTRESLDELALGRNVEIGLHPDALDDPSHYAKLFAEQAVWFQGLTGSTARIVRNHGFLNDGYWEHAGSWIDHGVSGSSNLPGFDGSMLNGSLLPAPLLLDGQLTSHWSILTAIGDGIVFVNNWDDTQSAQCIYDLADRIRRSGVPGVIVLNLHPENIEKTRGMHEAARKLVEGGFVAWTLGECLEWFEKRDRTDNFAVQSAQSQAIDPAGKRKTRLAGLLSRLSRAAQR